MAKPTSRLLQGIGRFVKGLVAVLLVPPVIGATIGLVRQLEGIAAGTRTCSQWFVWGIASYLGLHLLFYRPKALFRFNHALLARLAVWLFGGQVSTVGSGGVKGSRSSGKGKDKTALVQGSTLVVLSPYLVPLYLVLVSVTIWLLARWIPGWSLNGFASVLIGASLAFHIAMTAEDLQQDRERFPVETHLMTLAISGLCSLLVCSVCLPLAIPEFSVPRLFADAIANARAIYTNVINTLFF